MDLQYGRNMRGRGKFLYMDWVRPNRVGLSVSASPTPVTQHASSSADCEMGTIATMLSHVQAQKC